MFEIIAGARNVRGAFDIGHLCVCYAFRNKRRDENSRPACCTYNTTANNEQTPNLESTHLMGRGCMTPQTAQKPGCSSHFALGATDCIAAFHVIMGGRAHAKLTWASRHLN